MAVDEKWYFTKDQLLQSPSRKSGYDVDKELSCRQQAANFIQDMGQRLQVSQLCINTAIVYMHRFYVFHSLAAFHRNAIAAAALFLAAKVEEQPRKLEHVIKVAHMCLHRENPNLDTKSELYLEQAQDLVFNENVLLQTLGFDVAIDHPHTHVVRCCQLVRASKDLAQTSYFMASNSLHLTTMCLQYKPTVVACFCIHLACKWSNWEIPRSNEGKDWFWYIDKTVTIDLLEQLTAEFLAILDKCPTKLKRKMMSMNQNNTPGFTQQTVTQQDGAQFEEPRKLAAGEGLKPPEGLFAVQKSNSQTSDKTSASTSVPASHSHHQKIDYREYREKKERERLEREKQQPQQQRDSHGTPASNHHHHHHSKSNIMPNKSHGQSRTSSGSVSHKSYQQPPVHGMQQNMHSRESSKDSNYLKQHPPHGERESSKDNVSFHGQYSQNANMQHQGYAHKSEPNYSHRDGSRGSHSVPSGGNSSNLPQSHHNQSQMSTGTSTNMSNNPKEYLIGNQRESMGGRDGESQSLGKDSMSSSIRDIISQSVSQKDVHSMTNERKEHMRDKSRMNYIHGSSSTVNYRPDSVKPVRDPAALNLNEPADRKLDEFAAKLMKEKSFKKNDEETVINAVKTEPSHGKAEKFDETDMGNENGTWTSSNVKSDKSNVPVSIKSEQNSGKNELSVDPSKMESYFSNSETIKSQSVHSGKLYDSKYKTHHYHSSSKNSDVPQIKLEKPGAQCSSDMHKKMMDRGLDKHRKVQEGERTSHGVDGSGTLGEVSLSKHHKIVKEMSEKNKIPMTGQQGDQRLKEKMSPSLYQKMKSVPRPGSMGYVKSETGHHNTDNNSNMNTNISERNEMTNQTMKSLRPIGTEDSVKSAAHGFQKQRPHDLPGVGNQNNAQETNIIKSNKTSSIFSPDSKIPPQNILSSLEKDPVKKNSSSTHRSHSSNKTPPNSTTSSKKSSSASVMAPISTSTTSTTGSLFSPPLPKNIPSIPPRHRTPSSGSEPELIPVLTKLEDTPGYENIMKERKVALNHSNDVLTGVEKDKKTSVSHEKLDEGSSLLFASDHKSNAKEVKIADSRATPIKSDVPTSAKAMGNVKFPNEIRSDLGAVIYPTNPKIASASKSSQGFSSTEGKHSVPESVSTVNLLGIEKMVDTSISPAKPPSQFGSNTAKSSSGHFNAGNTSVNPFGSSISSVVDPAEKTIIDQMTSKGNTGIPVVQDVSVDVLGYSEKKKSEKKKKKEKHKHKEKDKDKSERKKEKKKHKAKDKERLKEREKSKDWEKQKEKERHKEKEIDVVSSEIPIKITIPKDKISGSLKFKISKDCLKKEEPDALKSNTSGELKIKISKDVISNISGYKEDSIKGDSRKRERSPKSSSELPHSKSLKTSEKKTSSSSSSSLKSNGTEGASRNSSSHRYSVSENGSCFDISSLYDLPFDFEENGHGIIKTPDYDFEALNASEGLNTSPDPKEIEECDRSSHNELDEEKEDENIIEEEDPGGVIINETEIVTISTRPDEICDVEIACDDMTADLTLKPISPITDPIESPKRPRLINAESIKMKSSSNTKASPIEKTKLEAKKNETEFKEEYKKDQTISLENCDVLKNYKTILDNHSKRCDSEVPNSPNSEKISITTACNNDDNNNKSTLGANNESTDKSSQKASKSASAETDNPNYYNKYFKKDGGGRIWTRDDKRTPLKESRFEDKQRYYDNRRYRQEYNDRDRRDDRRFYRDYPKDSSQYYFDKKNDRRFEYPGYSSAALPAYFNPASKPDPNLGKINYEIAGSANSNVYQTCPPPKPGPPQFPQMCETPMPANPAEMNVQFQYGYFNNFMYPNGYRFYGNVPYVNMSLIQQQQPIPPGTGDSFVQVQPPPLPLEPPPDLPPPPETPPPPK